MGIARTFQHVKLRPNMSVLDNVALGAYCAQRTGFLTSALRLDRAEERRHAARGPAANAARRPRRQPHELAGNLPLGEQRILEVARALAADPVLWCWTSRPPACAAGEGGAGRAAAQLARRRRDHPARRARHGFRHGAGRPARGDGVRLQAGRGRCRPRCAPIPRCRKPISGRAMSAMLEIADLHVAYGKVEAVRGVSLTLRRRPDRHRDRAERRRQDHAACRHHRPAAVARHG